MDIKDQRLEMRVSQQQLDDLDEIRHSLDSSYIPSRSDVARTFISNGIERFKRGGDESPESLPLGERLSLFFQISQYEMFQNEPPRGSSSDRANRIRQGDIVKTIYLRQFFWFFELDANALRKLSGELQSDHVLALINKAPNAQTVKNLNYVADLLEMFRSIDRCMDGDSGGDSTDVIQKLSKRNSVPLSFSGFEESSGQLNEMAAVALWLNADDRKRSPSTIWNNRHDTEVYTRLLTVYREHMKRDSRLTLDTLQDIMLDRSLG
ncbi:hypothetical protein SBH91_001115 [Pseudomonas putida]|nr:YfbU family protein [Pseudomonas putida]